MIQALTVFFILLLAYYIYFLFKIRRGLNKILIPPKQQLRKPTVSVIIPFRNEEENILSSLESIQRQDYPEELFEVFYINDSSDDNSRELIANASEKKNIKVLDLADEDYGDLNSENIISVTAARPQGKKAAVNYGIQNSTGEIIVTTDADCIHNPGWLNSMVKYFDDETAMVAGAVDYNKEDNLFSSIQRLEFAGLITAGAGLIGSSSPIICNAANLAYRRTIFEKVNGFTGNLHLSSGDDELLMQKIKRHTEFKIKFCPDRESVVKTSAARSLKEFFNQRKRWASKGLFYKNPVVTVQLILIFLFYAGLALQAALSLYYTEFLTMFLISLSAKIISEFLIMLKSSSLFFDKSIFKYFLFTELLQIPYIIITSILGAAGNFNWKNRKLKR
jgi:cellulose synthase/poly-beta-1,6-N-acetylglucosamine synthase-like glycosyltransferase